jgi:hypothetical protein
VVQEGQERNQYEIAENKERGRRKKRRRNGQIIKEREGEKENNSRNGSERGEKKKRKIESKHKERG